VAAVVAAAGAYLSPALKDGGWFGPYDEAALGTIGHPATLAATAVHNRLNGDLIHQGVPWNLLDRSLIHSGHLPLWNPDNVLGLPQLFNFESGAFSLPDLVSYAVPLRYAWLVLVFVKLVIAGTGTYALCRRLGARPVASVFGAITFMLSGGLSNWLGWSLSGVVCWAPWVVALILLAYRDPRRRFVVLLALAVMFAYFGGFPEMYLLLAIALLAAMAVATLVTVARHESRDRRGACRSVGGLLAGTALASPLLLPGGQLLGLSTHGAAHGIDVGAPAKYLTLFLAPGYYGTPLQHGGTFAGANYYETVSYLGLLAIALAVTGAVALWRRPAVAAMIAFSLVSVLFAYRVGSFDPIGRLFDHLGLHSVHTSRIRLLSGLGVGVLAALGLDALLDRPARRVRTAWLVSAGLGVSATGALALSSLAAHLSGDNALARERSLIWPGAMALAALGLCLVVLVPRARAFASSHRALGATLLTGGQAAFLLFAGVGLNSYAHDGLATYPGVARLQAAVGSGIVGFDGGSPREANVWAGLGCYPNLNIAYGVAEFAAHDPLLPSGYARTFVSPANHPSSSQRTRLTGLNMPDITSGAEALSYGIEYLLVQPGRPLPAGTTLVTTIAGQRLVRVAGASRAWLLDAYGHRVGSAEFTTTSNNEWSVRISGPPAHMSGPHTLVIALSSVPGMTVSAGGRSLPVRTYRHFEMAVTLPAGTTVVAVRYWPSAFTLGLGIAGGTIAALGSWCLLPFVRRRAPWRHRAHRTDNDGVGVPTG
jgi:hypothetical protein